MGHEAFLRGINSTFTGNVINRENIGKTGEQLVARWNELNPQDQVE